MGNIAEVQRSWSCDLITLSTPMIVQGYTPEFEAEFIWINIYLKNGQAVEDTEKCAQMSA